MCGYIPAVEGKVVDKIRSQAKRQSGIEKPERNKASGKLKEILGGCDTKVLGNPKGQW